MNGLYDCQPPTNVEPSILAADIQKSEEKIETLRTLGVSCRPPRSSFPSFLFPFLSKMFVEFIDFLTPFADPAVAELFTKMPSFAPIAPYITELKRCAIPAQPTCEGVQCTRCNSPILRSDPMDFYDDSATCCVEAAADAAAEALEEYEEDVLEMEVCMEDHQVLTEIDEDEFNDYIDQVLDEDYDY